MTTTIDEAGRTKAGGERTEDRAACQGAPLPSTGAKTRHLRTQTVVKLRLLRRRIFNDSGSSSAIGSFRIGDFITGVYDAGWRIDGLGDVAPISATRFSGAFDSFVNFNFGNQLAPGLESRFIFLDTNAVSYARNAIYDLTNLGQTQISGLFSTYGPIATVPDPASVALLAIALAALLWVARRRPFWHEPADVTQLLLRPSP